MKFEDADNDELRKIRFHIFCLIIQKFTNQKNYKGADEYLRKMKKLDFYKNLLKDLSDRENSVNYLNAIL